MFRLLKLALVLVPLIVPAAALASETRSSHLLGQTAITIERPAAELPATVRSLLGPDTVEYESFVVAYLPLRAASGLATVLATHNIGFTFDDDRRLHLPFQSFDPAFPAERSQAASSSVLDPTPVPDLWLVRFAYPVKSEWLDALKACGLEQTAFFQHRAFLVRGSSVDASACGLTSYVDWVGPYLATDRVATEYLTLKGKSDYWLQFVYGTDLRRKVETLPEGMAAKERYESADGEIALVHVETTGESLAELAARDADLLSVTQYGVGEPSDERQGAIVAGLHDGTNVTAAGYRSWLDVRGLLTAGNQQIVGVIDTGYDDGTFNPLVPTIEEHHLDLERPERLADLWSSFFPDDQQGHGTMMAGIIVGDGSQGSGANDPQGHHLGTGIAPAAKLAVVKTAPLSDITRQETAIERIRNSAGSTTRGHVINQSWNEQVPNAPAYTPITSYSAMAQFLDQRTRDANNEPGFSGNQPSLFVFSAGNFRNNCNGLTWNTVASPALAKNVIAVGATRSDRPFPASDAQATITNPPQDCKPCTAGFTGRPPNENADHVSRVADFSGSGKFFAPYPDTRVANNTRIKPDVVAPAVRVYSTVPYAHSDYDVKTESLVTGCKKYYPAPGHLEFAYHTYGTGTSFAAPVVSGVAALLRKRLLDAGIDAKPSLLKAGIIATAEDLGDIAGSGNGSDHRPSPRYGWGRVNLARLTDNRARFYRNEVAADAVATGQSRSFVRTIGNGSVDTYIVLGWTDAPAAIMNDAGAVLVNDLDLQAHGGVYRGNVFNENAIGTDNGYSYQHVVCACARDAVNNVEAIFIPAGTFASGGSITLKVIGANVVSGPQDFSLYAYNVQ